MGFVTLQSQKRPAMGMISQINMLKHERYIYMYIYTSYYTYCHATNGKHHDTLLEFAG